MKLDWLHNDNFLKLAGIVVALAVGLKHALPPAHIAAKVCDVVLEVGVALGVYSTTGRAKPDKAVPQ